MADFIEISAGEPVEVPCGPLVFRIRRREVGDDGGISIALYGPRNGEEAELLRFDLFRKDPHYHVPAGTPQPTGRIDPASDTLAYALDRVANELPSMLRLADAADHAESIETLMIEPVVTQLREAAAQAPEPSETKRIELTPEIRELVGLGPP